MADTTVIQEAPQQVSSFRKYWTVCMYCFIASFAATTFGFDNGTQAGLIVMPRWLKDFATYNSTTGQYVLSAGATTELYGVELGVAFLASTGSGWYSAYFGRKSGILVTAVCGIIGSGLQMIPNWSAFIVGRVFAGASIGFAGNFAIAYWSETAPVKLRGMIVILYQLNVTIPSLVGSCIDQATHAWSSRWSYWVPLLIQMVPPVLICLTVWFLPESPRWLVTQERVDEARQALRKVRGKYFTDDELNKEIEEVIAFTQLEKELDASTSYVECFKGTDLRRTLVSIMCQGGQQVMGISFIAAYGTYFFNIVGEKNAFVASVITNACQMAGSMFAVGAVKYIGRRPLLIIGCGVCAFSMLAFATVAQADPNGVASSRCIVAFMCIFVFSFSATWGSVCPVVIGEVGSNRLRSKTVSLGLSANWLLSLAWICSLPYMINPDYANLGTKVGFIFGSLTTALFVVVIFFLPETMDRSLEEIDEMFLNRVPTWKFKSYVCTGQAAGYDVLLRHDEKAMTAVEHPEI